MLADTLRILVDHLTKGTTPDLIRVCYEGIDRISQALGIVDSNFITEDLRELKEQVKILMNFKTLQETRGGFRTIPSAKPSSSLGDRLGP